MIKKGQVLENYQGRFARVLGIKDNGLYHLTVWHQKRENAEVDEKVAIRLNDFGLSQVLKGGENAPKADGKAETVKVTTKPKAAGTKAPKADGKAE
jgi:hypothetical protein